MAKKPATLNKPLVNRIIGNGVERVDQLLANPLNFRIHPDNQQQALAGAIDEVGFIRSVTVNQRTGRVVDGHLRVAIAARSGVEELPVEYVDLTEDEERLALLSLDPIAAMAAADKDKLDELLKSVQSDDERVRAMMEEIARNENIQLHEPPEDPGAQIDKAEELRVKWGVESGQLWQLGEHRLICGDCTDRATVERVMGGEKARLCFTSPPYGDLRDYEIGDIDFIGLYKKFSELAFSFCDDVVVNLGLIHKAGKVFRYWDDWLDYCEEIGSPLFGWYVWDQMYGMPGDYHGRLARSHEWVFHFSKLHIEAKKWIETTGESLKRGTHGKRFRQKDGSLKTVSSPEAIGQPYKIPDSVIRIGRETARGIHTESHPATYPIEFAGFGINTWSSGNDVIYEPFSGSGTTIIACETLGRKCRAIEISPAYVAVALQRWADMTGKTPTLLS